jgi:hypothetical protein
MRESQTSDKIKRELSQTHEEITRENGQGDREGVDGDEDGHEGGVEAGIDPEDLLRDVLLPSLAATSKRYLLRQEKAVSAPEKKPARTMKTIVRAR